MVTEKNKRPTCNLVFEITSFQHGGQALWYFRKTGREGAGGAGRWAPRHLTPTFFLPLTLTCLPQHLAPCCPTYSPQVGFLFLCLTLSSNVPPHPLRSTKPRPQLRCHLSEKTSLIILQTPSFSVLFCLFFLLLAPTRYCTMYLYTGLFFFLPGM